VGYVLIFLRVSRVKVIENSDDEHDNNSGGGDDGDHLGERVQGVLSSIHIRAFVLISLGLLEIDAIGIVDEVFIGAVRRPTMRQ
jgi:hypothetical protein